MAFGKSLGEILFDEGWSLGPISSYIGPLTEARLVQHTGYDDYQKRSELCLDALKSGDVISNPEYVEALMKNMVPGEENALRSNPAAPRIEAVLPNGKKVELGETASGPKFS